MLHFASWYRLFKTARVWLSGCAARPSPENPRGPRGAALFLAIAPKVRPDCEAWSALLGLESYSNPMSRLKRVGNFSKACTHLVLLSAALIRDRFRGARVERHESVHETLGEAHAGSQTRMRARKTRGKNRAGRCSGSIRRHGRLSS